MQQISDQGIASPVAEQFAVTEGYRWYVAWLLFAVAMFNFVDRQIFVILLEPIKKDFDFTDAQLGMLSGLAFAALYSILGIPIARLADRRNRVKIISTALFVWSLFTVFTGMARTFTQLFLMRVGVGIGEAGCSPTGYSLLADYFDKKRRTRAITIFMMGIYGGMLVGYMAGAILARHYGWRLAFFLVGIPGVFLALLLKLTLREPPRGFSDGGQAPAEPPPLMVVFRKLSHKKTFIHLALAGGLHAFAGYGVSGFLPSFFQRTHHFTLTETGVLLSLVSACSGMSGTWFGGWLADRLSNSRNEVRWQLWVPGIATLMNVPIAMSVFSYAEGPTLIVLMFLNFLFGAVWMGPTYATMQRLVGGRERALASAILLLLVNLFGLGLGPWLVGHTSDFIRSHFFDDLDKAAALGQGLRWALVMAVSVNAWSGIHYLLAARTMARDIET